MPKSGHHSDAAVEQARHRSAHLRPSELLQPPAGQDDDPHLEHSLFAAAQVQRNLCGPRHWRRTSFELAGEIFPVRHLSGDFISVIEVKNELRFAIGDIAGKGLQAAMWFTQVVSLMQLNMLRYEDPAAALDAMNSDLHATPVRAPLTTVFLGALNLDTGRLRYSGAGHPPALLLRSGGSIVSLSEGGLPLNALPASRYRGGEICVEHGDTLVGFSDGIVECNNRVSEEFGVNGLTDAARKGSGVSAAATLFCVLGEVGDFAASRTREDDFALLVLRREHGAVERIGR